MSDLEDIKTRLKIAKSKLASKNNIRDRLYSIELNSLRVDVWAMTGGGFTTREMFPIGLCEFVEINNFLSYIDSLK